MDNNRFPRVLIVTSDSMRSSSQTSLTLKNFWGKWPEDKLFFFVIGSPKNDSIADNEYFLPASRRPVMRLAAFAGGKKINISLKTDIGVDNNRRSSRKQILRQFMYSLTDISPIKLNKEDLKSIDSFCPDVIYTMGSSVTTMKVAQILSKHYNIKILIHVMDNWPISIQWSGNPLLRRYQKRLTKQIVSIYKKSGLGLTIGYEMAEEYFRRFHIRQIPLMNPVNISEWKCEEKPIDLNNLVFVYAGGLHLNRYKTITAIAESLKRINESEGCGHTLIVYTDLSKREAEILRETKIRELDIRAAVNQKELHCVYSMSDILVLAENIEYDEVSDSFARYSISTKTAEYLAAEKPVIYVGNESRALYHYLKSHNAAVTVSDLKQIDSALKETIENREELCKCARDLAEQEHDGSTVNSRLIEIIAELNSEMNG